MEINKDMQKQKSLLKDTIYHNYQMNLAKYQNSDLAYQETIHALENMLNTGSYNSFAETGDIQTIFPNPVTCIDVILDDFIDIMLKSNPQRPYLNALLGAMIVTQNSHGKDGLINALKKGLKEKDYSGFSRYHDGNQTRNYRQILQNYVSPAMLSSIIANTMLNSTIRKKDYQDVSQNIGRQYANQISNFQINPYTFDQCRKDILEGEQISLRRCDYSVGNDLYASIDIGNKRTNQEDSVIILNHPQNPNFKMLVVADGMGGQAFGEQASSLITSRITNWFEGLSPQYFASQNIEYLKQLLNREIQNINQEIYHTYNGVSASTFVGAIVADGQTVISNVGDSRAYIYSHGELRQLSEDDSLSYNSWKSGIIQQKDDIRFHKLSNMVTKGIGLAEEVIPTTSTISNSDYDTLLLFSDGVTDCLSDQQIMAITRTTPPEDLARALVDAAKNNNSEQHHLNPEEYANYIAGGKDNTTAAVYDKRSKNSMDEGR